MIKDIVAHDPNSKYNDLDSDPVAEVFGIDGRGTVKGYGHGVSKTTLTAAAPYKRKAQEEYMSPRHFSASAPLFHEGPMNSLPRQSSISAQQACELLSIGGRVVAFGTISTNSDGTTYKVIIDEVEDWTAELFGVIGKTFGDIDVGHTVDWPLILTRLV
ncbi:hypothetical protein AQUCO_02100059v1 [Aquilegia coerulea]|uniref:Uncharacterized protein n=1 Tax=Aquilegia coerulea TaxID=218851 RepID=A0A2G5DEQ5_AQUCA|nr:hypothetical protein AQUCO_02100059v1 [Aquilegia coerulea]